jgi:hypothetical protein
MLDEIVDHIAEESFGGKPSGGADYQEGPPSRAASTTRFDLSAGKG